MYQNPAKTSDFKAHFAMILGTYRSAESDRTISLIP